MSVAIVRSACRKPASGGMNPELPTSGSTMIAASGVSRAMARTVSESFNGVTRVSYATASGTPGEFGSPSVATPEPARTRKESACP